MRRLLHDDAAPADLVLVEDLAHLRQHADERRAQEDATRETVEARDEFLRLPLVDLHRREPLPERPAAVLRPAAGRPSREPAALAAAGGRRLVGVLVAAPAVGVPHAEERQQRGEEREEEQAEDDADFHGQDRETLFVHDHFGGRFFFAAFVDASGR